MWNAGQDADRRGEGLRRAAPVHAASPDTRARLNGARADMRGTGSRATDYDRRSRRSDRRRHARHRTEPVDAHLVRRNDRRAPRRTGGDREPVARRRLTTCVVWATQDHPQSRSLLAGEKVIFVPEVGERDVAGRRFATCPFAHRLHRRVADLPGSCRPDREPRSAFCPTSRRGGVSAHYVECATRVERPSLTGNGCWTSVPGVHRYTQWKHQAHGTMALRRLGLRRLRRA